LPEESLLVGEAKINALFSLAGHMPCFATYSARTALKAAPRCCTGARSQGDVSSSRGAPALAGSQGQRSPRAGAHTAARRGNAELCEPLPAQAETRGWLCRTKPRRRHGVVLGQNLGPLILNFKREVKSNENFYFYVIT